jgi:hypothetical protein
MRMALRTFTDRDGATWNAWQVIPNGGAGVQERFRDGWVCFERVGGGGRCRLPLSEMPPRWDQLPDVRLELLRRVADVPGSTGTVARAPKDPRSENRS